MLILLVVIEENKVDNNKYRNIKKSENKMIEILAKLKSWNLSKSEFGNLFIFKNTIGV